jgi:sec-independent protein translocase protein TatB
MPLLAIFCIGFFSLAPVAGAPLPMRLASFGIPDTLFIVVIALIVFGPKKLPEISRQIGKLLYEFRKASNDFKFQIEEELRAAEQAERQKELSAQAAIAQPATPIAITAGETVSAEPITEGTRAAEDTTSKPATLATPETATPETATTETATPETPLPETPNPESSNPDTPRTPTIQPPASGLPVSTRSPYRSVENAEGATEVTAAGESLDEPQALDMPRAPDEPQTLDELQANAQDAVRAAAADLSHKQPGAYNQPGDAVPTHHG